MESNACVCGSKSAKNGICEECMRLLRAKRSKNIKIVEKFREDYNRMHGTYKSYGQFVAMLDGIARRKNRFDSRRQEKNIKKLR